MSEMRVYTPSNIEVADESPRISHASAPDNSSHKQLEVSPVLRSLIISQEELVCKFSGFNLVEGSELTAPLLAPSRDCVECALSTLDDLVVNAFLLRSREEVSPEHYRILARVNPWLGTLLGYKEVGSSPISGDLKVLDWVGDQNICLDGTPAGARIRSNAYKFVVFCLEEQLSKKKSFIGPLTVETSEKWEQLARAKLSLSRSQELEQLACLWARLASESFNLNLAILDEFAFCRFFTSLQEEIKTTLSNYRAEKSPLVEQYEDILERSEELKINSWTMAAQNLLERSHYENLSWEQRGWAKSTALKYLNEAKEMLEARCDKLKGRDELSSERERLTLFEIQLEMIEARDVVREGEREALAVFADFEAGRIDELKRAEFVRKQEADIKPYFNRSYDLLSKLYVGGEKDSQTSLSINLLNEGYNVQKNMLASELCLFSAELWGRVGDLDNRHKFLRIHASCLLAQGIKSLSGSDLKISEVFFGKQIETFLPKSTNSPDARTFQVYYSDRVRVLVNPIDGRIEEGGTGSFIGHVLSSYSPESLAKACKAYRALSEEKQKNFLIVLEQLFDTALLLGDMELARLHSELYGYLSVNTVASSQDEQFAFKIRAQVMHAESVFSLGRESMEEGLAQLSAARFLAQTVSSPPMKTLTNDVMKKEFSYALKYYFAHPMDLKARRSVQKIRAELLEKESYHLAMLREMVDPHKKSLPVGNKLRDNQVELQAIENEILKTAGSVFQIKVQTAYADHLAGYSEDAKNAVAEIRTYFTQPLFVNTELYSEAERLPEEFNAENKDHAAALKQLCREAANCTLLESLAWSQGGGIVGACLAAFCFTPAAISIGYGVGNITGGVALSFKNVALGRERISQARRSGLSSISCSEAALSGAGVLLTVVPFGYGLGKATFAVGGAQGVRAMVTGKVLKEGLKEITLSGGYKVSQLEAVRCARTLIACHFGEVFTKTGGIGLVAGGMAYALGPAFYRTLELEINDESTELEKSQARAEMQKIIIHLGLNLGITKAMHRGIVGYARKKTTVPVLNREGNVIPYDRPVVKEALLRIKGQAADIDLGAAVNFRRPLPLLSSKDLRTWSDYLQTLKKGEPLAPTEYAIMRGQYAETVNLRKNLNLLIETSYLPGNSSNPKSIMSMIVEFVSQIKGAPMRNSNGQPLVDLREPRLASFDDIMHTATSEVCVRTCAERATLFVSFARALGYPSRLVQAIETKWLYPSVELVSKLNQFKQKHGSLIKELNTTKDAKEASYLADSIFSEWKSSFPEELLTRLSFFQLLDGSDAFPPTHIFVEVFFDGKWNCYDPQVGVVKEYRVPIKNSQFLEFTPVAKGYSIGEMYIFRDGQFSATPVNLDNGVMGLAYALRENSSNKVVKSGTLVNPIVRLPVRGRHLLDGGYPFLREASLPDPDIGINFLEPTPYTEATPRVLAARDEALKIAHNRGISSQEAIGIVIRRLPWINNKKNYIFRQRSADQILADQFLVGCSDVGRLYAAIARSMGIPTCLVDALDSGYLSFSPAETRQNGFYGHVFVKLLLGDKWCPYEPIDFSFDSGKYIFGGKIYLPFAIGADLTEMRIQNPSNRLWTEAGYSLNSLESLNHAFRQYRAACPTTH